MKKYWMMFRPEGVDVIFMWIDDNLTIIADTFNQPKEDWFWHLEKNNETSESETLFLNSIQQSRKKIFVKTGTKRRYQVLCRGEIDCIN